MGSHLVVSSEWDFLRSRCQSSNSSISFHPALFTTEYICYSDTSNCQWICLSCPCYIHIPRPPTYENSPMSISTDGCTPGANKWPPGELRYSYANDDCTHQWTIMRILRKGNTSNNAPWENEMEGIWLPRIPNFRSYKYSDCSWQVSY